jgi:hypothetical protein
MEQAFALYNFWYERKANQFRGLDVPEGIKIVSNDIVGQCFLGIVLKRPADARRRKYKVWSESYDQIFTGQHVEPHVLSVLIYLIVQSRISANALNRAENEVRRKLAKGGVFHLARVVANRWRNADTWSQGRELLQTQIAELQGTAGVLDSHLDDAIEFIAELIESNSAFANDIDGALKSSLLEREITRELRVP